MIQKKLKCFTLIVCAFLGLKTVATAGNLHLEQSADSLPATSTIILYHPAQSFGGDYYYDVFLNDSLVYTTEWGTADTITVEASKEYNIWAKTGAKESFPLKAERGKTYYIRCSTKKDLILSHPFFELVEKDVAEKELNKIKNKKD